MSICFDREEIAMEFEREHVAWLSDKMGKGRGTGNLRKVRKERNQMASLKVCDIA